MADQKLSGTQQSVLELWKDNGDGTFSRSVNVSSGSTIVTGPVDTELPPAAALADASANPTTPTVGADILIWNGATWDRATGNIANGLDVDVTRVSGTVTVDSELPAAAALADAAADPTVPTVGADNLLFNGTTWDRMRGDITNGLDVDVTRVSGTVTTKEARAATPAQSSVANSTSSVSLLASNANRLGATIYNDDSAGGATLKVKLGATASATSFTVAIKAEGYFEVPFGYTGAIDGIASAATGNARITELTA